MPPLSTPFVDIILNYSSANGAIVQRIFQKAPQPPSVSSKAQLYLLAVSESRHSTRICFQDSERNFFRFALFDSCVGGVDFHYSEKNLLDV